MSVRCVFYDGSDPCPCGLLRSTGAEELPAGVVITLTRKYCTNLFLTCPIYVRLQRKLEAAHQMQLPVRYN